MGNRLNRLVDVPKGAPLRKGLAVSTRLKANANKIAQLSRHATKCGVILAAAGADLACVDIANTEDQQKRMRYWYKPL